jgi:type VI secretion system secreted protein Hcp
MAQSIYVTVKAATQGAFKGTASTHQGGRIAVVAFEYGLAIPIDSGSGQPLGRRQHRPVVFTKQVDAASPQFLQSAVTNEVLKSVLFEFLKIAPDGKEVVDHTITLTNGIISSFQDSVQIGQEGGPVVDSRELEQISLTYQKLEMANIPGKTSVADAWLVE